ncbi:MAG: YadA C-terminal domain-containing protein [Caecibacter sp.]|nr:YadA C-terminal domain-containing protein [Megasphaera sp.]MEE0721803.1 YadA C-terminal domain-containing protein [Caecibacter sp.]
MDHSRVDTVGAHAAALAALHPLDFDPDDKLNFAVGTGHYGGESSLAVGAFYRPNVNTMFSFAGSVGGGENMWNAGVSIKVGRGSEYAGVSKAQLVAGHAGLKAQNAKQDEEIDALKKAVLELQNRMKG